MLPAVKIRTRERGGDENQQRTFVRVHVEWTIGVLHLFESESARLNGVYHGRARGEARESLTMVETREEE